jgi:hypothetical protein
MTTKKSDPHHDADRAQFDAELQEARRQLATHAAPAGAQAMPGLAVIWHAIAAFLGSGDNVEALWSLWKQWKAAHGGESTGATAPPEPST